LILNEAHLRAALAQYAAHYNAARPHQGIGRHVPDDDLDHPIAKIIDPETARTRRKRALGDLTGEYQAAAQTFQVTRGQRPESNFRVRQAMKKALAALGLPKPRRVCEATPVIGRPATTPPPSDTPRHRAHWHLRSSTHAFTD
jgi:hypothetical protein